MQTIALKTPRGRRFIGENCPVFIIAEMSGNHNQSYKRALRIIDAAAAAGADAIKLQTYTPDTITIDSENKYFQIKGSKLWSGQSLYKLYQQAYTPWAWQPRLKQYAENKGILWFSTPFDSTAVDFLEKMKVQLYKVASHEIIDIPLLKRIGQTHKPVLISRGMASIADIRLAIRTLRNNGAPSVAVLHCVSAYPALLSHMNLTTIPDIVKKFKVISGLSDHSPGKTAAIAAVALGASIIEKHLTLNRASGGPDAAFSLNSEEFKDMVKSIRETEQALGRPFYGARENESVDLKFRKSLFAVENIREGELITSKNVRSIRPGYGLHPKYLDQVIGTMASSNIKRGTPLSWNLIKR